MIGLPADGRALRLETYDNNKTCIIDVFEDGIELSPESKQIVISRLYFRSKVDPARNRTGKGNGMVVHKGGDLYLSETYFEGCVPNKTDSVVWQSKDNSTLAFDCRAVDLQSGRTLLHSAALSAKCNACTVDAAASGHLGIVAQHMDCRF